MNKRVFRAAGTALLLALSSGCMFQGKVKPVSEVAARQQAFDAVWLSKRYEQPPAVTEKQVLVTQAHQRLKQMVQAQSEQDLRETLQRLPGVLKLALGKMNWQPLKFDPPVVVVQEAYTPATMTLDVQMEVDRVAWLAQLKQRLKVLNQALLRFKRVPDQVNALKKVRAMLPALPVLLHRMQVRKMIWRLDPESRQTKLDRMADSLMLQLVQTSRNLVVEVDTEVEKKPQFEQALNAAMVELGFKLLATRPADLFIIYDLKDKKAERHADGVALHYDLTLKLADANGAPFAIYPLTIESEGSTVKLARLRAMEKIARDIQDKVVDYLLEEYRILNRNKGTSQ